MAQSEEPWEHHRLPWHIALVGIYAVAILQIVPGTAPSRWDAATWTAVMSLTVVVATYFALLTSPKATMGGWRVITYLVVMVVGVSVAIWGDGAASLYLFAGFTHTWALTGSRRTGTIFSAALSVGCGAAMATGYHQHLGWAAGALIAVVICGFSIAMGLSILQLVDRAQQRSRLAAQLAQTQRQLAEAHWAENVTAQRERIAQDIHDTLAQGFTSIVMLAQVARADVAAGRGQEATGRLELIERTARDNLAEARTLVSSHAPVDLAGAGLGGAIGRLAARLEADSGIDVAVHLGDMAQVPPDAGRDVVVLRACQEALANIRKHAGASRVDMWLSASDGEVHLAVQDDGVGMPRDYQPGIGLESMRARAMAQGGTVSITPGEGGLGTRVELRLPAVHDAGPGMTLAADLPDSTVRP